MEDKTKIENWYEQCDHDKAIFLQKNSHCIEIDILELAKLIYNKRKQQVNNLQKS